MTRIEKIKLLILKEMKEADEAADEFQKQAGPDGVSSAHLSQDQIFNGIMMDVFNTQKILLESLYLQVRQLEIMLFH